MALNEVGPLQFHGPGAKECEEFVAAVAKYAYGQGRLRDDAWIADFAAICLAGDALRWWSALDEETQGSWRLLRQAMFSRYRPLFYGHGGEEAEHFVFSVRQRILDAGKQKDNEWIITFVSGCFVEDALRWHVSLDSSIREDWSLLEAAILAQYPRNGQPSSSLKIPVPPLAAAPPPKTKNRGRIRASKKNDTALYYLSRSLDEDGRGQITSSIAEAIEVEYNPSTSSPRTLHIPDGQIIKFDVLGLGWARKDATETSNYAFICAVNTNSGYNSLDKVWSGPRMTNIWLVASNPSDGNQLFPLTATVTNGTDSLSAHMDETGDETCFWFDSGPCAQREIDLSLFFEPL